MKNMVKKTFQRNLILLLFSVISIVNTTYFIFQYFGQDFLIIVLIFWLIFIFFWIRLIVSDLKNLSMNYRKYFSFVDYRYKLIYGKVSNTLLNLHKKINNLEKEKNQIEKAIVENNIALLYNEIGDSTSALELISNAINDARKDDDLILILRNNQVFLHIEKGEVLVAQAILDDLKHSAKSDTQEILIILNQSNILINQSKINEAIELFDNYRKSNTRIESFEFVIVLISYAKLLSQIKNYDLAITELLLSLEISKKINNNDLIIESLIEMGIVNFNVGKIEKSERYINEAITKSRKIKQKFVYPSFINLIGFYYYQKIDYKKAREFFLDSLDFALKYGDKETLSSVYNNLGLLERKSGNIDTSIDYYEKSITILRSVSNLYNLSVLLINTAEAYRIRGKLDFCKVYLEEAENYIVKINNKSLLGLLRNNFGSYYLDKFEIDNALASYEDGLKIYKEIENKDGEIAALNNIGQIYLAKNRFQEAKNYFIDALNISNEIHNISDEAHCLNNIGIYYAEIEKINESNEYLNRSLQISKSISEYLYQFTSLNFLARNNLKLANYQRSIEFLNEAFNIQDNFIGNTEEKVLLLNDLGIAYSMIGEFEKGFDKLEKAIDIFSEIPNNKKFILVNNCILLSLTWANFKKVKYSYDTSIEIFGKTERNNIHYLLTFASLFETFKEYSYVFQLYWKIVKLIQELKQEESELDLLIFSLKKLVSLYIMKDDKEGLKSAYEYLIALQDNEAITISQKREINFTLIDVLINLHSFESARNKLERLELEIKENGDDADDVDNIKVINGYGLILLHQNDLINALAKFKIALRLSRKINEYASIALVSNNIAHVYLFRSDFKNAEKYFRSAYEASVKTDNTSLIEKTSFDLQMYLETTNSRHSSLKKQDKPLNLKFNEENPRLFDLRISSGKFLGDILINK